MAKSISEIDTELSAAHAALAQREAELKAAEHAVKEIEALRESKSDEAKNHGILTRGSG
jgi:chaperonin cofactor prefoldin